MRALILWLATVKSEPLVVFFALGVALFGLHSLLRSADAGREVDVIVVTDADVRRLAGGFEATWRRAPSALEVEALVREHVIEEAFVREALALGLDRGDAVVRQRLRQKMAFIAEAADGVDEPDDSALREHFTAHATRFASAPRVAFEQVFLGPGAGVEETASLLAALADGVDRADLGARTLLPHAVQLIPESVVTSMFGPGFFAGVAAQEVGRWAGPLLSAHGAHLVRLTEVETALAPDFEAVRHRVENDWRASRSQARREAFTAALLHRYRVERVASGPRAAP